VTTLAGVLANVRAGRDAQWHVGQLTSVFSRGTKEPTISSWWWMAATAAESRREFRLCQPEPGQTWSAFEVVRTPSSAMFAGMPSAGVIMSSPGADAASKRRVQRAG